LQGAAQLPHCEALHDQSEGDDQARGLHRCEDMQPHRRGDEPEGEAGKPGDERGREGGEQEKCQVKGEHAHGDASASLQTRRGPLADDGSGVGSPS
jgi:hypothetical protein